MSLKFKYAILILLSFLAVSIPTEILLWEFTKKQAEEFEMGSLRKQTELSSRVITTVLKSQVFFLGKLLANTSYVGEFPDWLVSQNIKHTEDKDEFRIYPKDFVYLDGVSDKYTFFVVKSDDEQNIVNLKVDMFKLFSSALPNYTCILDSSGRILYHFEPSMVGKTLEQIGVEDLYECYRNKKEGYCIYTFKEKRMGYFSKLLIPGKSSLYVFTSTPLKEIFEASSLISKTLLFRTIILAFLVFLVMIPFSSSIVKKLRKFMEPLREVVDVTNDLVEDLAASSEELASSVESMEKNAQNVMDEMAQTLEEVNVGENEIKRSTETIGNIVSGLKNSTKSLEELLRSSELVEKIAGTIKTISERINILSINAEIEASRREIDPRAFEALSREIGKLAMETQQKLASIEESVLNLKKTIGDVSNLNERITSESSSIMEAISKIHVVIGKMKDSISSLEKHFSEVGEASQDILAGSEQVAASAQHLKDVANRTQSTMKELEKGLSKI